jgi:hypothetical protein
MNTSRIAAHVLLVMGILGLIKAVFGLARPDLSRRFVTWWSKAALNVNTLLGCFAILIAGAIWGVVLYGQSLVNWLLLALGVLIAWAGSVYLRPERFTRLMKQMFLDRSDGWLRFLFICTALISLVMILAAGRAVWWP